MALLKLCPGALWSRIHSEVQHRLLIRVCARSEELDFSEATALGAVKITAWTCKTSTAVFKKARMSKDYQRISDACL